MDPPVTETVYHQTLGARVKQEGKTIIFTPCLWVSEKPDKERQFQFHVKHWIISEHVHSTFLILLSNYNQFFKPMRLDEQDFQI